MHQKEEKMRNKKQYLSNANASVLLDFVKIDVGLIDRSPISDLFEFV